MSHLLLATTSHTFASPSSPLRLPRNSRHCGHGLAPSRVLGGSVVSRPLSPWKVRRGGGVGPLEAGVDVELAQTVLKTSLNKAFAGGLTGSVAGVAQVLMFMWLRTAMNYQYRHGGSLRYVLATLWGDGGVRRFYRGLPFAIVQGPLSRFGSAAANCVELASSTTLPCEGVRRASALG